MRRSPYRAALPCGYRALVAAWALSSLLVTAAIGAQVVESGGSDRYSKSIRSMGTFFEITVRLDGRTGQDAARAAVDEAFEVVARLDALLSVYKPDSEISSINRNSGGGFLGVDPLVSAVLDSSLFYRDLTGGAFDVTVGPLLEVWGFRSGRPKVPADADLARALALVGAPGLQLDRDGAAARLARAGQRLDLGGIGKGYALDRAADVLRAGGIAHAMLNSGGNLLFIGEASPGTPWKAGVVHPRAASDVIARFQVTGAAVSTSGDYENYFMWGGKRYSHILDPGTGRPSSGLSSVTVIAPAATGADALSTAIVVMGREAGMELVESLPGVEAIVIMTSDLEKSGPVRLSVSSGLAGKLEALGGAKLLTSPAAGR